MWMGAFLWWWEMFFAGGNIIGVRDFSPLNHVFFGTKVPCSE